MKILFIGDVVGRPGREVLENNLAAIEGEYQTDFTIVNGENSSGGFGMDLRAYNMMSAAGADAFTMGNHTFDNRKIFDFIGEKNNIIRPLNLAVKAPGVGYQIFTLPNGEKLSIVNLLGQAYSNIGPNSPFEAMEKLLSSGELDNTAIFVDFHGDATSEKVCFGHHFDGRVSAICGTHTHIQTADEKILSKGTAFITDAGMTGAYDSCLGMDKDASISKFIRVGRHKMQPADGERQINGVVISLDKNYKGRDIERVQKLYSGF